MKAFVLEEFDAPPRLRDDLPEPEPGDGELLVRVGASTVNPIDNAIGAGMLREMFDYEFPVTLGRDFAGVVEGVGPGVDSYQAGDQVFGYISHADPNVHRGSWAELALVPADRYVVRRPAGVDLATAGVAAVSPLTAIDATRSLDLGDGRSVLIVGASGGVGTAAVQLAKRAGAKVIAPGLPEDEGYLRDLGVDEMVPRDGDVAAAVRELEPEGATALLDAVSRTPEDLSAYEPALAEDARIASTIGAAGEGPGRHNAIAGADLADMRALSELLEEGALRVPIQRTYPLAEVGAALADLTGEHTQGKLAISI